MLSVLDTAFARVERFFGAQQVPESAAQEERRAINRTIVCFLLPIVFFAEFATTAGAVFPVRNIALAVMYGFGTIAHAVLLRSKPNTGPALIYLFAVSDPLALTLGLAGDSRSMPFLNPLLLTVIVGTGIRYGFRMMYLVWFSALIALVAAFTVEPYLFDPYLTLPFGLMLVLVPFFFSNLIRRIYRGMTLESDRFEAMNEVIVARSAFLGRVSHEIRSPLQSMVSALDLFELRYGGRELDGELVGRMRRSSRLLNTQLRDLLTLAKGQVGRLEMNPEPFEVVALMQAMAESVRPLAVEKGLQLVLDTPHEPTFVVADGARIDQVLTNLTLNSIRYTDAGQVRTAFEGFDASAGRLTFTVSDTGPGIPDSILPTLFEADRSSSGSERRGSGSGMGLAIVRVLSEHLGGEIAVTSRANVGTTFTLRIPAAPAEGFEAPREGGTGKVLVVDDRVDVLDAMIEVIQELGFACDRATSASAGAYLLATSHYDAAFVDIDMPSKSGAQLVDEARQGTGPNRDAHFVGMSAADVPAAVRQRFHQCLAKPIDRSMLQRALRSIYPDASASQQKLWR